MYFEFLNRNTKQYEFFYTFLKDLTVCNTQKYFFVYFVDFLK
jgi:hypothetical protein